MVLSLYRLLQSLARARAAGRRPAVSGYPGFLALTVLFGAGCPVVGQQSPDAYRLRGTGDELRREGVKPELHAGSLSLLSFIVGPLPAAAPARMDGRLRVRYHAPGPTRVSIAVRELRTVESYQLDADRVASGGWSNSFAWPTAEVIDPLHVDLANLGVVVTRDPGRSGTIFPAIFGVDPVGGRVPGYTFVVRPTQTCAPLVWTLFGNPETVGPISTTPMARVPARAPKALYLDATGLPDGRYTMRLRCEREGRGSGAGVDAVVRAFYDFHHTRTVSPVATGGGDRR